MEKQWRKINKNNRNKNKNKNKNRVIIFFYKLSEQQIMKSTE